MLNYPLELWVNPTWSWCMSFFMCCWMQFTTFFEEFCIYIHKLYYPIILGRITFVFGFRVMVSIKYLWEFYFFYILEEFKKDQYNFIVCLVELASEAICSWTSIFHLDLLDSGFFFLFSPPPFFCILGPRMWHMVVPRLGVNSEMQLYSYAIATATQDPSCVCNLLKSLSEARHCSHILMDATWFHYH